MNTIPSLALGQGKMEVPVGNKTCGKAFTLRRSGNSALNRNHNLSHLWELGRRSGNKAFDSARLQTSQVIVTFGDSRSGYQLSGMALSNIASLSNPTMAGAVIRPTPIEPAAPYTGTLRYPIHALLSLARSLVASVESHHRGLFDAANARDDDDAFSTEADNLMDVDSLLYAIDRPRYRARVEKDSPGMVWTEIDLQDIKNPSYAESGLFTIGRLKSQWVTRFLSLYISQLTSISDYQQRH
jgi:hypothetical protein